MDLFKAERTDKMNAIVLQIQVVRDISIIVFCLTGIICIANYLGKD